MGNLIYKVDNYDNKAINFNEKLIQIERDICNETEMDNPIYYIINYGQPYHIYNDMKIYNSYNFDENKKLIFELSLFKNFASSLPAILA